MNEDPNSYKRKSLLAMREQQKKKHKRTMKILTALLAILLVLLVVFLIADKAKNNKNKDNESTKVASKADASKVMANDTPTPIPTVTPKPSDTPTPTPTPTPKYKLLEFTKTDKTVELASAVDGDHRFDPVELVPAENAAKPYTEGEDIAKTKMIESSYIVLADADTGEILIERDADKVVYPASMTKVLTVLTAMDYITEEKLDDHIFVCQETMNYVYKHDCSRVGFVLNQEVCVKDLIYGTIVCSGGDAALELAKYCCGSIDAFVEQMNKKVEELGLSETAHFTNPVGIFDENLHCTVKDIGIIMCAAMQNEFLRDVLKTRIYTTTVYVENDENIKPLEISNWFIRRIEDKETNGTVIGAKTGFVNQSRNCAVSYMVSDSGKNYVCVTGMAPNAWRAIYDHVALYRSFTS
ncbi:MAG: D-alanyl-D-alanine carboxypeptidase [Lachnospiraceae bacterium]|nr:D-alanyl-D-alanine carboxypeptidase [Lachnospiraceae bacterium]